MSVYAVVLNSPDETTMKRVKLERRVGILESKIGEINDLCIKIDTKLENVATTTSLWKVFAGTLGISVATFIGHILLRYIQN